MSPLFRNPSGIGVFLAASGVPGPTTTTTTVAPTTTTSTTTTTPAPTTTTTTTTTTTVAPKSVTYLCNGGTGCPANTTFSTPSYTIPGPAPTRAGFTFGGYSVNCSGSDIGTFIIGDIITCGGNLILSAIWNATTTTTTTTVAPTTTTTTTTPAPTTTTSTTTTSTTTSTTAGPNGTKCTAFDVAIGCCSNVGPCSNGFGTGASCSPITDFAPQSGC